MKIVILDAGAVNPGDLSWESFEQLGECTIYDHTQKDQVLERAFDADVLITNKTKLSGETITSLKKLKYIGLLSTGYDIIDISTAKANGIIVSNVPNYSRSLVCQHTISLLLHITNKVAMYGNLVNQGKWSSSKHFCLHSDPLTELCGKTYGIIGYGKIGKNVAQIASAIGMKVVVNNKSKVMDSNVTQLPLNELLTISDVISLHCPLTPQTTELICASTLSLMKSSAILINTARGGIIKDSDLAEYLNSGRIAAAGLDVLSEEPSKSDNPLLYAKNCTITPHIAWAALETRKRLIEIASNNLKAFINNNPINIV